MAIKTITTSSVLFVATSLSAMSFAQSKIMFDDFNYQTLADAEKNGWVARTQVGHPGIKNATWWQEGISFHPDKYDLNNQVMRLTSKTDGTATNTRHTQICHQRKYREGTYAARVYFNDEPQFGPDGDGVVETFYTISPLDYPMAENYSEMDFEYLANGGWGQNTHTLFSTSWETFQLEPWTKVNAFDTYSKSLQGWNTLVLQVNDEKIKYYINGYLFSEHGANVYPEQAMSINFNLWFMPEKLVQHPQMRQYFQDVDWVYFNQSEILSEQEVLNAVAKYREQGIKQKDSVPDWQPKLASYCGL
ncbi:glycoside hydrolase family 16 protein [Catenovulum sp. SM1970]|uniref:glycoside hydrolase family 16 protein n=1 Tax=Marinifaba aquimaris TaxID=2741323 RepID=UPI001572776E|nr:glycoside hydrolase family 16 protein [Marinifaba aquimaris]NTS75326.1 glycoside hydrolase family 16 protein [Marinifaba aquimaris]